MQPTSPEADARWAAIATRDGSQDGCFWYGVTTTGVYCLPSCGARTPKPANVQCFESREAAETARFRPCKRCKPDQPPREQRDAAVVAEACRVIDSAEDAPGLEALAAEVGLSPSHFHRMFKQITGLTPRQYAAAGRERRLREGLASAASVTDAIYGAGYNSTGRFYEDSKGVLGMTPTTYKSGGATTTIRFAVGQCSLGALLVAASELGLCAIALGDDPDTLVRDLQDRFPKAELRGGDAGFEGWVARVVGFVEAPALGLDLPFDLRGTAFQQRVWQALREIPAGKTASYLEVATAIGRPSATRAVAQACGANPLAVAIPCHRVVRTDGGLSGYRWGVDRKRALLARESQRAL